MKESTPPVMILGCGRSGTSIFGELFNYIGNYAYHSEPPFNMVVDADYSRPRAFKVPRESESYTPDPGLSFPLRELQQHVPNMKYFWIVRHPLDAICSLKIGVSMNWGHHPRPLDWKNWLSRPLVEQCAHHWAYINSVGFEKVSDFATVVHFETMVENPRLFAISICEHLGLDPDLQSEEVESWSKRVQNTNNIDFKEAETSRRYSCNDHSVRIGRWRENLSITDVASALPLVRDTGILHGYNL